MGAWSTPQGQPHPRQAGRWRLLIWIRIRALWALSQVSLQRVKPSPWEAAAQACWHGVLEGARPHMPALACTHTDTQGLSHTHTGLHTHTGSHTGSHTHTGSDTYTHTHTHGLSLTHVHTGSVPTPTHTCALPRLHTRPRAPVEVAEGCEVAGLGEERPGLSWGSRGLELLPTGACVGGPGSSPAGRLGLGALLLGRLKACAGSRPCAPAQPRVGEPW